MSLSYHIFILLYFYRAIYLLCHICILRIFILQYLYLAISLNEFFRMVMSSSITLAICLLFVGLLGTASGHGLFDFHSIIFDYFVGIAQCPMFVEYIKQRQNKYSC